MMLLQRAALLSALIVLALTAAIASPAKGNLRKKRDSSDFDDGFFHSSSFSSSFNGDGFLTSGSDYPSYGFYSRSAFPFLWPLFSFPPIVPWYKGPNVCKDTKYADEPEEFKDMSKGSRTASNSGRSRQESCEGDSEEYTCRGREMIDGQMKMYKTVYSCCHGFVRNPRAPGCTEGGDPSAEDGPTNNNPPNDDLESF